MKVISIAGLLIIFLLGRSSTLTAQAPHVPKEVQTLLSKYACTSCHMLDKKLVGPSFVDIAAKKYPEAKMIELIYRPDPKNWPDYPHMESMPYVPDKVVKKIAKWLVHLGQKKNGSS